jgi:hypothetical protein
LEVDLGVPQKRTEFLKDGWRAIEYARVAQAAGSRLMTSALVPFELLRGRLEGKAQSVLVSIGMPFRMRQRLGDVESTFAELLTESDFADEDKLLSETMSQVERIIGGNIEASHPDDLGGVFSLVELLQRRVFLDLVDCSVYADSVLQEADEIVTYDKHLRSVVNRIHNPGGEQEPRKQLYWAGIRDMIVSFMSSLRDEAPADVTIPKALKPPPLMGAVGLV